MEAITYTQIQQLVEKLPETKLPLVYRFLLELVDKDVEHAVASSRFYASFSRRTASTSIRTSRADESVL